MSDKIKADDLFDGDPFSGINTGLEEYVKNLSEANLGMKEMIKSGRDLVNVLKLDSSASIDKLQKSITQLNTLIIQSTKLTAAQNSAESKAAIESQKLSQQKIKSQQEYEKLSQQKLRTEKLLNQEKERTAKAEARAIKDAEKLNSAYAQLNSQYISAAKNAKDLAAQYGIGSKQAEGAAIQARMFHDQLLAIDQTVGQSQRNVGNYNGELGKLGKGLKGLGGLGNLFARIFGIDTKVFEDIKEAGKAVKEFHHAQELEEIATRSQTEATAENTIATEANIAAEEEMGAAKIASAGLWGLLGVAIAAIAYGIYKVIDSYKQLAEASKVVDEAIEKRAERINELIIKRTELSIKLAVLTGKISKSAGEDALLGIEGSKQRGEAVKTYVQELTEAVHKAGYSLNELNDIRNSANAKAAQGGFIVNGRLAFGNEAVEISKKRALNEKLIELEKSYRNELKQIIGENIDEINLKKKEDEIKEEKRIKDHSEKVIKEAKYEKLELGKIDETFLDDAKKREAKAQKDAAEADKFITGISDRNTSDKGQKDVLKHQKEVELAENKSLYDRKLIDLRVFKEAEREINAHYAKIENEEAKKRNKQILDSTLGAIDQELQRQNELRDASLDQDLARRERSITQQQSLAEKGFANQLAFEQSQLAKDELQKAEQKKKELRQQKALAYLKLIADDGFAKGTLEFAISQAIAGSFKDGVEGLNGPGTETSDSILARLSKNESVITAAGTKDNPGLATAMNEGNVNQYFKEKYLPEYMTESSVNSGSFATNIANSAMIHKLSAVENKLEKVIQVIRERPVHQSEITKAGDVIETKIKNGLKEVVLHKTAKRPL